MFLKSIKFIRDIQFESNRSDHKQRFKVKRKSYKRMNYRKRRTETIVEKTFTIFPQGLHIEFKNPITILVGDNGTGKTSLLKSIYLKKYRRPIFSTRSEQEDLNEWMKEYLNNGDRELTFASAPNFFVQGKSIHKNQFVQDLKESKETLSAGDVLNLWYMQESSNGENTLDFIKSLKNIEGALIILDEPETSLSIRSQLKVKKALTKLSKKNQLIVVTHSPVIMNSAKEVYDFETHKYRKTDEYLEWLYK